MKKKILIEGILFSGIGFVGLVEALRLVSETNPHAVSDAIGPGYYILFLSLALMAVGALHIVANYGKGVAAAKAEVDKGLRKRMIGMILGLAFYTLAIGYVGYLVSTVLFFLLEFWIVGIKSWRTNILLTVVLAAAYYIIFVKYCDMVFPRGIF
jgi:putative tricarboxylic transport membrane protein